MKLRLLQPSSWSRFSISRVFNFTARFYRTETISTSSTNHDDFLYRRISRAGNRTASMAAVLEKWLDEGRDIKQSELQRIIKQLRHYRRFHHALEVSEWMSDQRNHELTIADVAVRLDLISKVRGLEEAENYFNSLPRRLRVFRIYGALLNCYAHNKSLDKAEATMQIIKGLGQAKSPLSYNVMLKLYFELEQYEKLDILMQEMEGKGIKFDKFTYSIRLNAYGASSDFEAMENFLMKMDTDPEVGKDWNAYIIVANWYLKSALTEKALAMLKKSEHFIEEKSKNLAYEVLMSLYATMGIKNEVYRLWNLYKNRGKLSNTGYLCMISSLVKLDDIDEAEKILEEWDSWNVLYDFRLPNVVISAYCRKGLFKKAEAYIERIKEMGKEVDATTWDRLATGHYIHGQMAKSVETMKKAIMRTRTGWKPNRFTLAACLKYLKDQGDVEVADELLNLLGKHGHSVMGIYDELASNLDGKSLGSQALDQIEREERIVDNGKKKSTQEEFGS